MTNVWFKELWRIFWLVLFAFIAGIIVGNIFAVVSFVLGSILIWYLFNLRSFVRWFEKGKTYSPPKSIGIFGDLFNSLYRVQIQQRKRNKRLVSLLSRFKDSTKAMPDGIVILQENGEIEWWNDAAVKLINLNYPKDVGQRITNLLRHPGFIRYYNLSDKPKNIKIPSPADEHKIISVRIVPYGNNQHLVMIRDVTILQRVEDMQRDFIANISHELRTPITVMSGFLEEFEHNPPENKKQWQHYIRLMQGQSSRMRNLVEDLMMLSRLDNQKIDQLTDIVSVPFIMHSLKEEAVILSGDRKHNISLNIDEDLYLRGDARSLDSAFANLVFNAVNYSPDGAEIALSWSQDENGAYFVVKDNGIGIPAQHLPRLTERFYRVDVGRSRDTGGSGLGLAIVNNVLSRHEALLRIESEVGKGSQFTCEFPKSLIIHKNDINNSKSRIINNSN